LSLMAAGVPTARASTTSHRRFARNGVMKKLLGVAAIAFALFYLLTQPAAAADAVRNAVSILGDAFDALTTFFNHLIR
jgi:uncharacterized membrane protein